MPAEQKCYAGVSGAVSARSLFRKGRWMGRTLRIFFDVFKLGQRVVHIVQISTASRPKQLFDAFYGCALSAGLAASFFKPACILQRCVGQLISFSLSPKFGLVQFVQLVKFVQFVQFAKSRAPCCGISGRQIFNPHTICRVASGS